MKKILALLLVFMLLLSILSGCGKEAPSSDTTTPAENTEALYLFRDLPEAKYITPAADFAGGDGSEANPYQIANVGQLALLHERMVADHADLKDHYEKAHYILTADISLNDVADFDSWETGAPEYAWLPIGFDTVAFRGVLDGQGHVISGLYINTNCGTATESVSCNYGLFDTLNGTVKNLTIEKSYFAVSGRPCGLGSIAGLLMDEARIENCASSAVLVCYDSACGGIAGNAYGGVDTGIVDAEDQREIKYSTISACTFSGAITQEKDNGMTHIGGIIGDCDGNIENCVNLGTILFAAGNVDSVGGIAGYMSEGAISSCRNEGVLRCETSTEEGLAIAGGIVGKVFVSATGSEKYMSRGASILSCENAGTVEGQLYAGGIAGQVSNDHNDYCVAISGCTNSGAVSSQNYTGGIVGHMNCVGDNGSGESILLENCENKADLSHGTVGGILASFMSERGNVTFRNCRNTGSLTTQDQHCAGIIAYWLMNSKPSESQILLEGCENTGSITSSLNAGGIVSYMDMPVCLELGNGLSISLSGCANSGTITTDSLNGYIGGILGNWGMAGIPTVIENCANSGTLAIAHATDGVSDEDAKIMTLSRIAGGIVGRVGPGLLLTTDSDEVKAENVQSANPVLKITSCASTGELEVADPDAENIRNWFGGIIGNTCGEDGYSLLVENCTYSGFPRGLGNDDLPDVGTGN